MNAVQLVSPVRHSDVRGWFTESYSVQHFESLGIVTTFVQDNHSFSGPIYTLRGLHFQSPPRAQAKLIRCIVGRIFDVVVDLRLGSPTFGKWAGFELTSQNGLQLYIPIGFAHGFLTLEPNCEVIYKCSDTYAPEADGGIAWDSVGIDWPLPVGSSPNLSVKDGNQPSIGDFQSPFEYDGYPLSSDLSRK